MSLFLLSSQEESLVLLDPPRPEAAFIHYKDPSQVDDIRNCKSFHPIPLTLKSTWALLYLQSHQCHLGQCKVEQQFDSSTRVGSGAFLCCPIHRSACRVGCKPTGSVLSTSLAISCIPACIGCRLPRLSALFILT